MAASVAFSLPSRVASPQPCSPASVATRTKTQLRHVVAQRNVSIPVILTPASGPLLPGDCTPSAWADGVQSPRYGRVVSRSGVEQGDGELRVQRRAGLERGLFDGVCRRPGGGGRRQSGPG